MSANWALGGTGLLETWAKLAEIGCDLIQGSQFGRPAPAADLLDRLRDREDRDAVPAPAGLVAAQASRRASSAIHAP